MKSELKRLLKIYEGLLLDVKKNIDYETIISINMEMVFLKSKFEPINKVEYEFLINEGKYSTGHNTSLETSNCSIICTGHRNGWLFRLQ